MSKTGIGFYVPALIVLALCTGGLAAQEADGISVEVTADRVEEDELNSAAHTTIITAEDIAASGKTSLADVLEDVAGVQFRSVAGPEQAQINMRGFGENSFGRVLVLLDGKRLNRMDMQGIQWLSVPLQSVDRIEVVRGGNSVLYGNSAVGGVINIITRGPVREKEFSSTVLFGGHISKIYGWSQINQQQIRAGLGTDGYDLDVNFEHQSTDGYRERTAFETMGVSIGFEGRPADLLTASIGTTYNQTAFQLPGGLTLSDFENAPETAVNQEDQADEYLFSLEGGVEWLPTADISVFIDGLYEYQWKAFDWATYVSFSDTAYHTGQINPKLVIDMPYAKVPLKIVSGADIYLSLLDKADYMEKGRENLNYTYTSSLSAFGGYVDVSAEAADDLWISGGGRYDTALITAVKDADGLDEKDWHHALVFDGALTYKPGPRGKVYLKGGTIFRYPFTDEQTIFTSGSFNKDLDPESGWNIEIGGKFSPRGPLTAGASIYFLSMKDEIAYYDPDGWLGPLEGYNTNLDETMRIGGDLEAAYAPFRQFETGFSYSYVWAVFSNGTNEGNMIPLVPAHTVRGSAKVLPVKGLEIEPVFSFVSEAYQGGDNANTADKVEAYWLADLVVRYRLPAVEELWIVLRAENLLDAAYAPVIYWDSYYPAPGRSLTLSATYTY